MQHSTHGQVVTYAGDQPVETAKNGLLRVGSHSRYGFEELRLKPLVEQCQEGYVTAENLQCNIKIDPIGR